MGSRSTHVSEPPFFPRNRGEHLGSRTPEPERTHSIDPPPCKKKKTRRRGKSNQIKSHGSKHQETPQKRKKKEKHEPINQRGKGEGGGANARARRDPREEEGKVPGMAVVAMAKVKAVY